MSQKILKFENPDTHDKLRGYKSAKQAGNNKTYSFYRIEYWDSLQWQEWQGFFQVELFLKEWKKLTDQKIENF